MNRLIPYTQYVRRVVAALAATSALLLACRFSATPTPIPPTEIGFLPLTAVASVTPESPDRRVCPVPRTDLEPFTISDLTGAASALRSYLNGGGDPTSLEQANADLEMARPDLDGDGWVDLVFILQDPSSEQSVHGTGTLLAFHCQEDQFELAFAAAARPDLGAPQLHSSSDLNGDGRDDLLFSRGACGAHTCTAQVQLLMWIDGDLENRFEGPTDDLPSPRVSVRTPQEGPADIAITAQGINSVGAGPFRPITQIWTWDAQARRYRQTREQIHQTDFRIHLLQDADRAALHGDHALAIGLYQQVIEDDALRGWLEPAEERRILRAYARYRQVVSALLEDDPETASGYLRALRKSVAEEAAASAYLDLAETFWNAYQLMGDIAFACQEARAYAAAHRSDILDPLYFGYTNPSYAPKDVCPFGED